MSAIQKKPFADRRIGSLIHITAWMASFVLTTAAFLFVVYPLLFLWLSY